MEKYFVAIVFGLAAVVGIGDTSPYIAWPLLFMYGMALRTLLDKVYDKKE